MRYVTVVGAGLNLTMPGLLRIILQELDSGKTMVVEQKRTCSSWRIADSSIITNPSIQNLPESKLERFLNLFIF